MEEWRPIAGYEGLYEISSEGRVRACGRRKRYLLRSGVENYRWVPMRVLAPSVQNAGYQAIHLCKGGRRFTHTVHRLVASAFCRPSGGPEVDHRDGDKLNNKASNLRWVTAQQNSLHAVAMNRGSMREVKCIETGKIWPSIESAARELGRSATWIKRHLMVAT